jgi:hypothetical protein
MKKNILPASNLDELVKSRQSNGTVKSARCKTRESLGMRRTYSTLQ